MGTDVGRRLTHAEWTAEGRQRFGKTMDWRFVCPVCRHAASAADYRAAGAPWGAIGFSCVGRWCEGSRDAFTGSGPGPCNYAGGGLFGLNPVVVVYEDGKEHRVFEFAEVADG